MKLVGLQLVIIFITDLSTNYVLNYLIIYLLYKMSVTSIKCPSQVFRSHYNSLKCVAEMLRLVDLLVQPNSH